MNLERCRSRVGAALSKRCLPAGRAPDTTSLTDACPRPAARFLIAFGCLFSPLVADGGCRPAPRRVEPRDANTPIVARVEWGGCAGIRAGPVCELGTERQLTLWMANANRSRPTVVANRGKTSVVMETETEGGIRSTLEIPKRANHIEVALPDGAGTWSLNVSDISTHQEIDRWLALGRSGKYLEALVGLEQFRKRCHTSEQGLADAAIGRMALGLGKFDRAEPALRSALEAAKQEQRIGDVVRDGSALIWGLVWLEHRFADARAVLTDISPSAEAYPEGLAWLEFHAALLAASTGDVRTALEKYRSTERRANRLGLSSLRTSASTEIASELARVGRIDEALDLLRGIPAPEEPCARATWALNLAWIQMERAVRLLRPRTVIVEKDVSAAVALADATAATCPDPHRRLLSEINAAEYAIDTGDEAEAGRRVEQINNRPRDSDGFLDTWRIDVNGRLWLARGAPARALRAFDDQVLAARSAGLMEETFRGEVGAGRALLALGRRTAAVARLRRAQFVLEDMLRAIPLGEGRGSFLGGHEDVVRYLVQALVEGGEPLDAMRVGRWARSAELAHASRRDRLSRLDPLAQAAWDDAIGRYQRIRTEIERETGSDWTLARADLVRTRALRQMRAQEARNALDEAYDLLVKDGSAHGQYGLSRPNPGEVFLSLFPGTRNWYAFAASTSVVAVIQVEQSQLKSAAAAADILARLDRQLGSAKRIRFFPYGDSDEIDWHSVVWRGRPLVASVEVDYGLDVPPREKNSPVRARPSAALVVADPSEDLPSALAEGATVERFLGLGARVLRLDGAKAFRAAVIEALPKVRFFHYAGHAQASSAAGDLSGALLLAGNSELLSADLLALPSVPELVILSACEAARVTQRHPSLMGLGQTFIAAGARAVIAPSRIIGDRVAREFVVAFYSSLTGETGSSPDESVHRAFRSAALRALAVQGSSWQSKGDSTDWQSFRLLVP